MFVLSVALAFVTASATRAAITWNLGSGGAWDTTTANWTGDSTTFTDNGTVNVIFNNTAGGTITIATDMSPLSTTVSATFSAGSVLPVELDGATADKLLGTGAINLGGCSLTVAFVGSGFTESSYVIAEGSSLSGTFGSVTAGYEVTYTPTQAILSQSTGTLLFVK